MTDPKPPYFRAPPLPIDIERDRRLGRMSDFEARLTGVTLGFRGRKVQAYESMTLGGMTMIADPVWILEKGGIFGGQWQQWRRFAGDGWLVVDTLPEGEAPPRSTSHDFKSAAALIAYEEGLRRDGLALTARYARKRDKALRGLPPDGPSATAQTGPRTPRITR